MDTLSTSVSIPFFLISSAVSWLAALCGLGIDSASLQCSLMADTVP